jgi:hypothetical protein
VEEELYFTIHARKRMRFYGVTEAEVREALARTVRERIEEAGIRFGLTAGGRRLKIVLSRGDPRFVVTVATLTRRR